MLNRGKLLLTICIAIFSFPLAGCWDLMELNKAALITGVALEPGHNGRIKATIEIMNASEAQAHQPGKGVAPSIVQTMEGNTISEILLRSNERMDRRLVVSHIRVFVIDERLAQLGLRRFLDAIQRSRYIREDVLILVSKGVHASGFMKILFPRGTYSSLKIETQAGSYRASWGGIPSSRLFDVNQGLLAEGRELILGAITIKGPPEKGADIKSIQTVQPKTMIDITGSAVFRDDKLLGFLPVNDSRMVLMASNQMKRTTLSVPLKGSESYAAIRLLHSHAHMRVSMTKGEPQLELTVKGDGIIDSVNQMEHLTEVSRYQHLEELTNDYVKQQMITAIQNVQRKFGVDVFGFGEQLYRNHYKQYVPIADHWNELFAKAPVKVSVRITLQRAELKTNHIKKEEIGP